MHFDGRPFPTKVHKSKLHDKCLAYLANAFCTTLLRGQNKQCFVKGIINEIYKPNAEYVKGTISGNLVSIYGHKYPGWSKLYVVEFALIKGLVA